VRLNIGCGNKRRAGFIGVDRYVCEAVDLLCDITKTIPFADGSIEEVYLDNVVEHISDIPSLMKELVRICRNGAVITIFTPHFTALSSWKDPTHVHHLSFFSFDHFCKVSTRHYIGGGIRLVARKLSFGGSILGLIGRLIFMMSPEWYERHLCFLFRASTLMFRLEVIK
jgi:SAM-dependent methyltransferase